MFVLLKTLNDIIILLVVQKFFDYCVHVFPSHFSQSFTRDSVLVNQERFSPWNWDSAPLRQCWDRYVELVTPAYIFLTCLIPFWGHGVAGAYQGHLCSYQESTLLMFYCLYFQMKFEKFKNFKIQLRLKKDFIARCLTGMWRTMFCFKQFCHCVALIQRPTHTNAEPFSTIKWRVI